MVKIGILGSDNSHALAFSKLCNLPDPISGEFAYPEFKVTHIFGLNDEETGKVVRNGAVENVVSDPSEMFGKVDAVMVVFRHGSLHAKYALPFIEAGVPTWIDKPFTVSVDDTKALIDAADRRGTLLTGGSTCKYAYDVQMLKNSLESGSLGELISGMINFPVQPQSEYSGIHFYAPHLVEMTFMVFGYDPISVQAFLKNDSVVAVLHYKKYDIVMNFTNGSATYHGILIGTKKSVVREIDISLIYKLGFAKFAEMIEKGKRPFDLRQLLTVTATINAIEKSMKSGESVEISSLI